MGWNARLELPLLVHNEPKLRKILLDLGVDVLSSKFDDSLDGGGDVKMNEGGRRRNWIHEGDVGLKELLRDVSSLFTSFSLPPTNNYARRTQDTAIATMADMMIITLALRPPIPLLPPPHIMAITTTIAVHPKPTADLVHDLLLIAILLMKAMLATAGMLSHCHCLHLSSRRIAL